MKANENEWTKVRIKVVYLKAWSFLIPQTCGLRNWLRFYWFAYFTGTTVTRVMVLEGSMKPKNSKSSFCQRLKDDMMIDSSDGDD